jgi:hypothetical protein
MLDVILSAICTRNQYTQDPAPVIEELLAAAGDRRDILSRVVGRIAGFYDGPYTRVLCAALREAFPESAPWVELGRKRAGRPPHSSNDFR